MNKVIFEKQYGHNTRQLATFETETFYFIDKRPEHIRLERKTEDGDHDWVLLTFEELEEIFQAAKRTKTIMKWVIVAKERGGDPHNDERARIVDETIEKCLEELGIKNGSFEAIELTETFLDYFEEVQKPA